MVGRAGSTNPPTSPSCAPATIRAFPPLDALAFCRAAFIGRLEDIDVATDRDTALARLDAPHRALLASVGFHTGCFVTAEQIHGNAVATIADNDAHTHTVPGVDGLATNLPGACLAIYVADCAAVYLADPKARAVALVHSGKKGTEQNIVETAVTLMRNRFGSDPADLTAVISPCIRPPHYEIDFAAAIAAQARSAGITRIHDDGICTASDAESFYSYRRERGQTGRMLAAIEITKPDARSGRREEAPEPNDRSARRNEAS